ncbi:putative ABC transporter [Polychaeton citri CBS 116435]|uniref:ABC transporter n=1 Tax=Polychaeton citri CBS 116435 TaxID=1314669 RepID=A0A9P4UNN3_9PEZI|nr:putative ABC transporter [Polychaeton citri CBS 116435]
MQSPTLGEAPSGRLESLFPVDNDVCKLGMDGFHFKGICWRCPWDEHYAIFLPCFQPVVLAVPLVVGLLIVFFRVIALFGLRRPQWTRSFVEEICEPEHEVDLKSKRRWTGYLMLLLTFLALGFVLRFIYAFTPGSLPPILSDQGSLTLAYRVAPVATWGIALALTLVERPRTTAFSVLTIMLLEAIVHMASEGPFVRGNQELMGFFITILALNIIVILIVFLMPMRDPNLPAKDISIPSTEPTSALRSPEDNLNMLQWFVISWMGPLISIGAKRQLHEEDVWQLPLDWHHRLLHANFRSLKQRTVLRRVIRANAVDLSILTGSAFIWQLLRFAIPVLMQKILAAMEDPEVPKSVPIIYALISLGIRVLSTQLGQQRIWFERRCYERSRGELITMLYEKTLNRKIGFFDSGEQNQEEKDGGANGNSNGTTKNEKQSAWQKLKSRIVASFVSKGDDTSSKQSASTGKLLNLMRNDAYEIAQRLWEWDELIEKPISIIFSVVLIVRFLGPTSVLSILVIIAAQGLNVVLAKILIHYERKRRIATDSKLQIITQFIEAIRHLRWYGWQGAWLDNIMDARQKELNLRIITSCWNIVITLCNNISIDLTPVVGFWAYTVVAGHQLRVDIAFPALQLFMMMNLSLRNLPSFVITWINAMVAVGRIEEYMAEPDKEETGTDTLIGDTMALEHASFAWPGAQTAVLKDVNISFPVGFTVICGEIGSGKTALLQGLLGELDMLDGLVIHPPQAVGFCAQTAWLQSMSVRENILFGAPYDEQRYRSVLDACALTPDLAEFKAGDLTLLGENGIGLSGGQKARTALARAVYSGANTLLLDDPLSALDQQTAEGIVKQCFTGPLMSGRTVVLVTHRTDLVLHIAKQVVKIEMGEASIIENDAAQLSTLQRTWSQDPKPDEEAGDQKKSLSDVVPEKFIEEEHRAQGSVQVRVYWQLAKSSGLQLWALLLLLIIILRITSVAKTWFVKAWGEAYQESSNVIYTLLSKQDGLFLKSSDGLFGFLPPPVENVTPWLITFLLLSMGESILAALTSAIMILITYLAGKRMFKDIMKKVSAATFRFYDVTPVGRLMNRMTSDIGVIDGGISDKFKWTLWFSISWISSVLVVASVTPLFLIFSVLMTVVFVLIFFRFLPTSQSLRRLEMTSLSPLISNFGNLVGGLTTVRAFRVQDQFQSRVFDAVDTFQKMDHFYWSTQSWLMYRYDLLSDISTFLLTMLALATNLTPGLMAFTLFAADKFVASTHNLCRMYGELQMQFVSVERVVELQELEQEPAGDITPPAWWPSYAGDIVFDKVTIQYAPHLDPALSEISFAIKGGSKTAVIGRTGSGKTTLALSLLATILPKDGQITIDNVDLAHVDKQLLRTRITFLAQDPVLFPGSMRQNLDPVDEHSDDACEKVLVRVCGRQGWDLTTKIEVHGHNLSQGQRQLVGLARAVLRRSAIIILDEATASIDRETAMQIQQVMHEELKESTVITIAHRLEAVKNADYCIVLGKGRVLEQGPADVMLRDHRKDMVDDDEEDEADE